MRKTTTILFFLVQGCEQFPFVKLTVVVEFPDDIMVV